MVSKCVAFCVVMLGLVFDVGNGEPGLFPGQRVTEGMMCYDTLDGSKCFSTQGQPWLLTTLSPGDLASERMHGAAASWQVRTARGL